MSGGWTGGGGAMWLDALLYDTGSDAAISIEADAWTSVAPWTWDSAGPVAPATLAVFGRSMPGNS